MAARARRRLAAAVLAVAFVAAAGTSAGASVRVDPSSPTRADSIRTPELTAAGLSRLEAKRWRAGKYAARTGATVKVSVSAAYASDPGMAQRWADFFASLLHSSELADLDAYIAPLSEVEDICRGDALGCYGSNHLVVMGETTFGITPESVARHEYGHHIAAHRVNPPWIALDWGTKRWASSVGICARAQSGTAYPGDEGANYSLNPGEAFAESYRVLMETNGSAVGFDWPILDPSFRPTVESLAALRDDVIHPWESTATTTIRGRFLRRARTWNAQVATPLDGEIRIQVKVPGGGADDVTLLSSDGRAVLATGSWDSSGARLAEYRVCGSRSLKVRVRRGGAAARFALRVTAP
jgi:hypothetical protein